MLIASPERTWQGIPCLERTPKGRLFVSWFSGGDDEPVAENEVYLCQSDDQGKTFSQPVIMAAPKDKLRAFDPSLWIDPTGRLWYIFNRGDKAIAKHGIYARICKNPDADSVQWSDEFQINLDAPFVFRLNKLTVLSTGEWIMPVTYTAEALYDWFGGDKQLQGVGISTDEGKSWKLYGALKAPNWALECMVVELKDTRLWMLMRSGNGFLWESHSSDKGKTWSTAKQSKIASPGARFFIRRLSSGKLLLVNHYQYEGRSHLTAQVSSDDGISWNEGLLLDKRSNVSYPDGVQDSNGLIWIVYDRERYDAGDILIAKFKEEDVMAGKNVSGEVSLKQVINTLEVI